MSDPLYGRLLAMDLATVRGAVLEDTQVEIVEPYSEVRAITLTFRTPTGHVRRRTYRSLEEITGREEAVP